MHKPLPDKEVLLSASLQLCPETFSIVSNFGIYLSCGLQMTMISHIVHTYIRAYIHMYMVRMYIFLSTEEVVVVLVGQPWNTE